MSRQALATTHGESTIPMLNFLAIHGLSEGPTARTGLVSVRVGLRAGRVHMLGSDSEPDQPSGDACQERKSREEPDRKWRRKPVCGVKRTPDDAILNEKLHP